MVASVVLSIVAKILNVLFTHVAMVKNMHSLLISCIVNRKSTLAST